MNVQNLENSLYKKVDFHSKSSKLHFLSNLKNRKTEFLRKMEREQTNKLEQNSEDEVHEGPGPPTGRNPPDTALENQIGQWVEGLRDDIDQIIEAYNAPDAQDEEVDEVEIEDWTVSKICDELKNGRFKNIVVFTGAGISTASGIPGKLVS